MSVIMLLREEYARLNGIVSFASGHELTEAVQEIYSDLSNNNNGIDIYVQGAAGKKYTLLLHNIYVQGAGTKY